ncbi:VIT1/CCC1 transporter family protein [Candidatus Peregrinibacteria bacterium]|nr:VIT1/CCC1 transporter family protein [Candidatus Peregrinibacteria bacterium]
MNLKNKTHAHHPSQVVAAASTVHNHEKNGKTGEFLSDIILGGQDGLVNTLGVILGLAAASGDFRIVVAGGLAGAIAEAVSMGAVGYTSKLAERDYYLSELKREDFEIENMPLEEQQEIREIYEKKGFKGELLEEVVKVLTADKKVWLHTMMREELGLSPVADGRPANAAILIGFSSFVGAIVPLIPFLTFYVGKIRFAGDVTAAIFIALGVSALTLFIVGAIKSKLTVGRWYRSGLQMMIIGILSALIGYLIGLIFSVQVS